MCWIAGLIQTISAGRLKRTCNGNSCALRQTATSSATED
jgi:hypothetical protein